MTMKVYALVISFVISVLIEKGRTSDIPSDLCSVVAGRHFKRFQSSYYDYFPSKCVYYLANGELTSTGSHAFEILLDTQTDNEVGITYIAIDDSEKVVEIRITPDGVFLNGNLARATLPLMLPQATVVKRGFYYILKDSSEIKIEYAAGERIYLFIPESIIPSVYGMCGTNENQVALNLHGWSMPAFAVIADYYEHMSSTCIEVDPQPAPASTAICRGAFQSPFQECGLTNELFQDICEYELNATPRNHSVDNGVCLALAEHYRMCALCDQMSVVEHWRNAHGCVVSCPNSKEFSESGSICPMTCDKPYLTGTCSEEGGIDGCHCPSGDYWNEDIGVCVTKSECFCLHQGQRHVKGETVDIDCNICTCVGGSWVCSRNEHLCEATCSITGKQLTLFRTFDGHIFQNTDSCEHLLVEPKTTNSTFYLSLGHLCSLGNEGCPSYLTLVTSNGGTQETLKFLSDQSVRYKNMYMRLPLFLRGVVVRNIMDNYLLINTNFGLTVMWDWKSDLEIKAADSLRGGVWGMCGLFNGAINDDLTLPTSEITTDPLVFGTKWRSSSCSMPSTLPTYPEFQGICRMDALYHLQAEKRCNLFATQAFHNCHGVVSYERFRTDCLTLACSATTKGLGTIDKNTCPAFLAYITECARQGQVISWPGYSNCDIENCPAGRVYLHCPHRYQLLCSELHVAQAGVEDKTCYAGCFCPNGTVFDDYSGRCVDSNMCPCINTNGEIQQAGAEWNSECEYCICVAGNNTCEAVDCKVCEQGQQYSECACAKTCANLHSLLCLEGENCQGGCACPEGMVLDEWNGQCVAAADCPCLYGNETYPVNTVATRTDVMCLCKPGAFWECMPLATEGSCWAYGLSSFNTYDDRTFSHNGRCSYVMSTDGCNENSTETFRVEIESLDCGEDAWACTKAIHITLPTATVDLIRGSDPIITPNTSEICTRDVGGTYTMVRYEGLAIMWDGANMVTITVEERFKEKVCGLCGNFDGRSDDDFLKQQGDTTRDVNEFVDSWATRAACLPAKAMNLDCLNEIEQARRPWAESKCAVINSDIFSECHVYVSPTPYFDHCVDDSVKCYRGDGLDCLCDAISAYAQKCIEKGVCADWRADHICPVTCPCDENRKYYTCHTSCLASCTDCAYEDKCLTPKVEGCFCKGDLVESNGTCIPSGQCRGKPPTPTPPTTQPSTTPPPTTQPPTTQPPTAQPPTTQPPTTQPPTTQPPTTETPTSQPPITQPPSTLPPWTQPTFTQPPSTQPPTTQPPTTQPPTTHPPTTQPPTTQPPTTQPPSTQPPTTQPPTTQPPTTQPPTTQPPTQQPPTTQPPITQPPSTLPPWTQPTFTQPPSTQPPTTKPPITQPPTTHPPTTQPPTIQPPTTQPPTTQPPTTQPPTTQPPTAQPPTTQPPSTQPPTTQPPTTETPTSQPPTTQPPTTQPPTTQPPTQQPPTTQPPITQPPSTLPPWTQPTFTQPPSTQPPTTKPPTTQPPTTHPPTTQPPTTQPPTTQPPTTQPPTTQPPTTQPPTTQPPTTQQPTTQPPTTQPSSQQPPTTQPPITQPPSTLPPWTQPTFTQPPTTQPPTTQPPTTQPPTTHPPTTQPPTTQPPTTQPPSTQPPTTQPPTTQPPTTQPPTTQPPTQQPPTTQPPITQPPSTLPPWTQPTFTQPPSTQPPTTKPPITQPPTTHPPTTQPPTTQPPTTQPPTAQPPTTQQPTTQPPTTKPPTTETPTSQPPTTQPPTTQPLTTQPSTQKPPTTQPPITQPPSTLPPWTQPTFTQPPSTQPPTTQPPTTQPPTTQPPTTQPPTTQPPTTQPSSQQPPTTQPPITQPPSTLPPWTQPTFTQPPSTQPPTTQPPSTQPPTTHPPTTQPPTTQPPTTQPPTTQPPTTQPPTTQPPTTQPPTTQPPTQQPPTTQPPITQPPSTLPPWTQPTFTQPPSTQPPTTKPPITQPPTTHPPTTQPPTIQPPTTQPPTTQPPTTQPPTTQPPTAQPPTTQPPTTQPPTTQPPTTQPPTQQPPTTQPPITQPPSTLPPWTQPTFTQPPTTQPPTTQPPTTQPPTTQPPTKQPPTTQPPTQQPPTTQPPITQPPSTLPPWTQPTFTQPPSTQPPTTQPPSTQPPTTHPPTTQPPTTQPPTTRPPTTQPPTTQPPTTQPPTTQPPTKQPPTTQPPTQQPPTTQPPITQPPSTLPPWTQPTFTQHPSTQPHTTQPPTTQPPTTQPPTTQPPTTQPPTTQPSSQQPPTTQPPITQPPSTLPPWTQPTFTQPSSTQPPTTQPPSTQPPTTHPPTTQPPTTQPPTTQPPTTQPPTTQPPTTQPPTTQPPTKQPPTTQPPTQQPPTTQPPITQPPSTLPPWTQPTFTQPPSTQPPTTKPPTTQPPTTHPPTTQPPTTQPPTTQLPTTQPPTTQQPTTQPPTTQPPTQQPPTTQPPTTAAPCVYPGVEDCGKNLPGLYVYNSCVAPGSNNAVVVPGSSCTHSFSVLASINDLEVEVLTDLQADAVFVLRCRVPDMSNKWKEVTNEDGTPTEYTIPARLGANATIRLSLGSLKGAKVETCEFTFLPRYQFPAVHLKINFDVCVTIDHCVPEQPGCRFNGKFYKYGDPLPSPDSCVDMTCDEMFGTVAQPKTCNVQCDGSLIHIPGQCCPECVPAKTPGCEVTYSNKTLRVGSSCRSTSPVQLGGCSGQCDSSVDSMLQNDCHCCQVTQTTQVRVPIECSERYLDGVRWLPGGFKNFSSISQCQCMECQT